MAHRQLNSRGDEAAERATSLGRRLGETTTQVVKEALRVYEGSASPLDERGFTPEQLRLYEALVGAVREARKHLISGAEFDDAWMYDENGLPK